MNTEETSGPSSGSSPIDIMDSDGSSNQAVGAENQTGEGNGAPLGPQTDPLPLPLNTSGGQFFYVKTTSLELLPVDKFVPVEFPIAGAGVRAELGDPGNPDIANDMPVFLPKNAASAEATGSSATNALPVVANAKAGSRFNCRETSALLKAIAWMGMKMRIDGMLLVQIASSMHGPKFWIEDYNGHGSILYKFYAIASQQNQKRNVASLKRKWASSISAITNYPREYFEQKPEFTAVERIFLFELAKVVSRKGV